jgi:hypothetical protein
VRIGGRCLSQPCGRYDGVGVERKLRSDIRSAGDEDVDLLAGVSLRGAEGDSSHIVNDRRRYIANHREETVSVHAASL